MKKRQRKAAAVQRFLCQE